MLYKETVTPETLQMLEKLMDDPYLKDFYLVGGTSLSLRYGHRMSDDIDLFTHKPFDKRALADYMEKNYDLYYKEPKLHGFCCYPEGQKVDFFYYPAPIVKGIEIIEKYRMLSADDVAAMKINSIAFDGTRVKDFVDIHTLLQHKTFAELEAVYSQKYTDLNAKEHIDMISQFKAVEKDFSKVRMLKKELTVRKVFGDLKKMVREYLKKPDRKASNLLVKRKKGKPGARKGPKL